MYNKIFGRILKFLENIIRSRKTVYITISVVASIIGLVKSFLFLKLFTFDELGLINLAQNFIVTISLLQLGIVTGGYRLFCYKSSSILSIVNSVVLYFFLFLFLFLIFCLSAGLFFFDIKTDHYYLFYFLIIGVLSLYANWVTCKVLAIGEVRTLNISNLLSAVSSLLLVFLYKYIGIWGALLTFLSQPLILIVNTYFNLPNLIPSLKVVRFRRIIAYILKLGFIPYLTTAIGFFNSQSGRWLITLRLGTTLLGKTSLANLYVTLVNLFPATLSNLFFSELISKYESRDIIGFRLSLKRYFLILLSYLILVVLGTVLFSEYLVGFFFSKHLDSLNLVYSILPSLVFLTLSTPLITVLNAKKKFKLILWGSILSVFVYLILLSIYLFCFTVNLQGFFIIESMSSGCFFLYNCLMFNLIIKKNE